MKMAQLSLATSEKIEVHASEHVEDARHQDPSRPGVQEKGTTPEQRALYEQFAARDEAYHHRIRSRLLRKVDWHLLPLLVAMYLLNFLDRNNLSQARLGSLEKDLGMHGTDFNLATSILFVGYILMQLPSNLLITRLRPSLYLGLVMTVWGIVSGSQGGAQNFAGLVTVRFFLGFVEAPFFAGAIFLMSSWYTRAEMAHRVAWFYSGSSLANAFGGLIGAGVLANLSGAHGIAGWRWLFIIEGSITVGIALLATIILPNYPSTTRWLTDEERNHAEWRLLADTGEADIASASTLWKGLKLALADKRLYLFMLLLHASLLSQTFQYFFPSIVDTLGYGSVETLLITAPVWIATFLVSLGVTYTSGKSGDRSIHIIVLQAISIVGNIIAVSTTSIGARFFAMFLMPMGAISAYTILVAWVANTFPRPLVKRSAAIAAVNMIANSATIYGSYMWDAKDAPRYIPGGAGTAGVGVFLIALTWYIRVMLKRANKRLAIQEVLADDGTIVENLHADDPEARAVGFRYIY